MNNTNYAQPNSSDEVLVTVFLESTESISEVNLYYGTGLTGTFEKTSMAYNSGSYTYSIPPQNSGQYVRFYVEAVNYNGSITYDPQGAEHDVYIYQVKIDQIMSSDLVINEIMASNDNIATDEFGEYDDWIEVYNKGDESINLLGYHLSDDISNLTKYTFPDFLLQPNQYFIVWADDDEEDQGDYNHATFKLSAAGEELYLSDSNLNLIDNCLFGEQQTDFGYARVPNGVGNFVIQQPTFNFNNDQTSYLSEQLLEKKLIKIIDVLGRDSKIQDGLILIEIYDDNKFNKKLIVD